MDCFFYFVKIKNTYACKAQIILLYSYKNTLLKVSIPIYYSNLYFFHLYYYTWWLYLFI